MANIEPGIGARRACEIVQLDQLIAHRIGNAFTAIADIDRPDPTRHRIEMLFALGIPNAHPLAFDNHARIDGFILLVLAKMVPDMLAVRLNHALYVVQSAKALHDATLSLQRPTAKWPIFSSIVQQSRLCHQQQTGTGGI
ncbi:MAG: hypothetical protein V9G14_12915 [Cypionkella sp.]